MRMGVIALTSPIAAGDITRSSSVRSNDGADTIISRWMQWPRGLARRRGIVQSRDMQTIRHILIATAFAATLPGAAAAQSNRPLLAVFAHPDDERVIGPLLSRLAREGRETHLVIATDGSKGVRDFAKIPAGAPLAAARTKEATCAANRLGVKKRHLLGLPDGGLASFD